MGGCNGRAMASWKKAMAHWYEQQKEWEYHFNMWKDGNGGMDYHDDGDYSGDGDWGSGGDWEWGSGMEHGGDMWDSSFWEQLMPMFEFMNSPDFCDMFMMMPAEWDPAHWTGLCHANQKLQKEIEEVIMYMMSGMMGKEDFSKKTCDAVGGYLVEAFELSYWSEGIPLVYAMESSCHCTHDFVYDLVMGNEMDWMAMYQCGQKWMGAMDWFNQPMIPQNWTVPAGAEQLLGLWMESKEDLDYFLMDPYNALMKYAKEWEMNPQEIVDGLNMWDILLDVQQHKLGAYGIEGDIYSMNSTDLYLALDQSIDRVHAWWDADADKHHDMEYDYDTLMAMDEEFREMIEFIAGFGFDTREMTRLYLNMYGMNEEGELNAVTYYNMYAETMAGLVANDTTRTFIPWDAFKWIVENGEMFYMAWLSHLEMDENLNEDNHSLVDHIFATWYAEIMKYMMEHGIDHGMKPMDEMMDEMME